MKFYVLLIAIFSAILVSACGSTATSENANGAGSTTTAADKKENAGDSAAPMSPTETLIAFSEATKKRNAAEIKKYLSKGSLEMVEKSAKEQNTTVDQLLTEGEAEVDEKQPEVRNEKISGDTATVEVKNEVLGNYDVMPFVKEDGAWKIALDKVMADMINDLNEGQREAPAPPPSK